MRETVVQFGEGSFLRAFADAFVDSLNKQGLYDGKIVIVKPRNGGSLQAFQEQNCVYHLFVRGFENGRVVDEMQQVSSVSRCIHPYEDYEAFMALASNPDWRFVISNTTEAGIIFDERDRLEDKPAASFPGKLTQLLYARYRAGLGGLVMLPCELIDGNGDKLKQCVLQYAALWNTEDGFVRWLQTENHFCNTLVDRIVTGFPQEEYHTLQQRIGCRDRLMDTAEPFHLWAIEGDFEAELPLQTGGIHAIWTEHVAPYKEQKVRILNGAHTAMVFPALLCGLNTVSDCLNDNLVCQYLHTCLFQYILPTLQGGEAFADAVLERFRNPFIRHQLTAIALNSVSKFSVRVIPSAQAYQQRFGEYPKVFALSLAALIGYYRTVEVSDDEEAVEWVRTHTTQEIVCNADLWQADISGMTNAVLTAEEMIKTKGIREAIRWAIS